MGECIAYVVLYKSQKKYNEATFKNLHQTTHLRLKWGGRGRGGGGRRSAEEVEKDTRVGSSSSSACLLVRFPKVDRQLTYENVVFRIASKQEDEHLSPGGGGGWGVGGEKDDGKRSQRQH